MKYYGRVRIIIWNILFCSALASLYFSLSCNCKEWSLTRCPLLMDPFVGPAGPNVTSLVCHPSALYKFHQLGFKGSSWILMKPILPFRPSVRPSVSDESSHTCHHQTFSHICANVWKSITCCHKTYPSFLFLDPRREGPLISGLIVS